MSHFREWDVYGQRVAEKARNRPRDNVVAWKQAGKVSVQPLGPYEEHADIIAERDTPVLHWDELCVPEAVLQKLRAYPNPSPAQSACWPYAFSGFDLVALAETGAGKTLAYAIPLISHCLHTRCTRDARPTNSPAALVIAPTRELAQQISTCITKFCDPSVRVTYSAGGQVVQNVGDVDALIVTVMRLYHLHRGRHVSLKHVTYLVFDEADKMLQDSDNYNILLELVEYTDTSRQTQMWTATWPNEVKQIAKKYMTHGCVKVNVGYTYMRAAPRIRQHVFPKLREEDKPRELMNLLQRTIIEGKKKALIFVNNKYKTATVRDQVYTGAFFVDEWHAGMSQYDRDAVLRTFAASPPPAVLVATDLAQRGLDIAGLDLVVNYDFPRTIEDYVHRIGRTGRSARTAGDAYTFLTWRDSFHVPELVRVMRECGQAIPEELEILDGNDVQTSRPWGGAELDPEVHASAVRTSGYAAKDWDPNDRRGKSGAHNGGGKGSWTTSHKGSIDDSSGYGMRGGSQGGWGNSNANNKNNYNNNYNNRASASSYNTEPWSRGTRPPRDTTDAAWHGGKGYSNTEYAHESSSGGGGAHANGWGKGWQGGGDGRYYDRAGAGTGPADTWAAAPRERDGESASSLRSYGYWGEASSASSASSAQNPWGKGKGAGGKKGWYASLNDDSRVAAAGKGGGGDRGIAPPPSAPTWSDASNGRAGPVREEQPAAAEDDW